MPDTYEHQCNDYDEAVDKMPRFRCGRLDMNSYNAETGDAERFIYFNDESTERAKVSGPYCDEIAYAAQRYKPMKEQRDKLIVALAKAESKEDDLHRILSAAGVSTADEVVDRLALADALADAVERDINHEGWQGVCDEEVAVEQALAAYRESRKGVSDG